MIVLVIFLRVVFEALKRKNLVANFIKVIWITKIFVKRKNCGQGRTTGGNRTLLFIFLFHLSWCMQILHITIEEQKAKCRF